MRIPRMFLGVLLSFLILISCISVETDIQDLIGRSNTSQSVQNLLNQLKDMPEISKYDHGYFYIYNSHGIDLYFSASDTLRTIHLYAESCDKHRQFQMNIPYGLNFNDTRKVVETKLGPPDFNGGGGVINYYSGWNAKGILVTYKSADTADLFNKIHHISISKKE